MPPKTAGFISLAGIVIFILVTPIFGLIQPGYDHIKYVISTLAVGEYGFIQETNFLLLAGVFIILEKCLGRAADKGKYYRNTQNIFSICTFSLLIITIFPTDPVAKIDYSERIDTDDGCYPKTVGF